MSDYTRIQNDTGRPIRDQLTTDGSADDITGATVVFTMWDAETDAVKIDENTANVTIDDAATGKVRYDFQSGDLDTAGVFAFEWEVTYADGTIITYRRASGAPKELRVFAEGA